MILEALLTCPFRVLQLEHDPLGAFQLPLNRYVLWSTISIVAVRYLSEVFKKCHRYVRRLP